MARQIFNSIAIIIITLIFLRLSYLMLHLSLPYLSFDNTIEFLETKQDVIQNKVWRVSFYTHVFSSMFILMAGFTQFFRFSFQRYLNWHRWLGKIYVFLILFVSGPSGLVMAFYANGGIYAQIGFVCLAVGWLVFTYLAYHYIRNKNLQEHQNFMIRSYAFTVSALTLRAWVYIIDYYSDLDYMTIGIIVAWLGWLPNWAIGEWIIWRKRKLQIFRA